MSTETKPSAWYWYDATGCLFITGDDRKPDVPADAKPLYTSPPPQSNVTGVIAAFEAAYPELYWHVAKGKITAGEPLYGAIITDAFGKEIGDGESDVSADEAFRIAIEDAGLSLATEGSDNG